MHVSPQVGESDKFLLVDIRNTAQGIRNPTNDLNPVPGIQNPRREIQYLRLSLIPLCMGRQL